MLFVVMLAQAGSQATLHRIFRFPVFAAMTAYIETNSPTGQLI
ncbi:hypothetical protein N9893_02050 [bacterium]|nr:hypothetical protein [bacterium]